MEFIPQLGYVVTAPSVKSLKDVHLLPISMNLLLGYIF